MLNFKNKSYLIASMVLLLGVIVVGKFGNDADQPTPIQGSSSYSIVMDKDNAPTTDTSYQTVTQTVRYTPFFYSCVRNDGESSTEHTVMGPFSTIRNNYASPITSVTSVTAVFSTSGTFTLNTTYDGVNFFDFPLVSGVTQPTTNLPYIVEFYAGEQEVTIESITITYTCSPHTESVDKYRVYWVNDDGTTILELDTDVEPGTMPHYDGATPTKNPAPGDLQGYNFTGWDIELTPVTGNQYYYATYSAFNVTFGSFKGGTECELRGVADKTLTTITIPSIFDGKPVTSIASDALAGFPNLTKVNLPSTLTTINGYAFQGSNALTSIDLPASVNDVTVFSFINACALANINVASANTTYASINGVLYNKAGDTLICYPMNHAVPFTIPSGVSTIGTYAFVNASPLLSLTIPSTVTTIGDGAFFGCSGLTSIEVPASVTYLGSGAFNACTGLTSATILAPIDEIAPDLFRDCWYLTSVTYPSSVSFIGSGAFFECNSLTSFDFTGIIEIGSQAFEDCIGLTTLIIPNGVEFIGDDAFMSCSSLTTVTIGTSVAFIGSRAFSSCNNLTSITVDAANADFSDDAGVLMSKDKTNLMAYPSSKPGTQYTIPASVKTIEGYAFSNTVIPTSVIIPTTVTWIVDYGFYYCPDLTIYCVASAAPTTWQKYWYQTVKKVEFSYIPS